MNISFGVTTSEKRQLDKQVSYTLSLSGTLRNQTNVVNPTILVEANISTLAACNYMSIPAFHRKYFITEIKSVNNGLCEVSGHCDVLSTFADDIRKNNAIVGRTSNSWRVNNLIKDDQLKISSKRNITTLKIGSFEIPSGVNYTYVMLTAG